MDDLDFFSILYQGWAKTTGAEDTYWMPEADEEAPTVFSIYAVDENDSRKLVASHLQEEDAAFITALHGCYSDLTRRLLQALDEAERFECEKDAVISEMVLLAEENNRLIARLSQYE